MFIEVVLKLWQADHPLQKSELLSCQAKIMNESILFLVTIGLLFKGMLHNTSAKKYIEIHGMYFNELLYLILVKILIKQTNKHVFY